MKQHRQELVTIAFSQKQYKDRAQTIIACTEPVLQDGKLLMLTLHVARALFHN